MNQGSGSRAPTNYELRIDGHLDRHWSAWFGNLDLAHEEDGTTSLTGAIADQAQLHGLLTKIRDLGVTLISLTVVDRADNHQPADTDAGFDADGVDAFEAERGAALLVTSQDAAGRSAAKARGNP